MLHSKNSPADYGPPGKDECQSMRAVYFFVVQPSWFLPLAQSVPPGPWDTPIPFLVLALPPLVVWVVASPLEFFWGTAALPVVPLPAAVVPLAPWATPDPFLVLAVPPLVV